MLPARAGVLHGRAGVSRERRNSVHERTMDIHAPLMDVTGRRRDVPEAFMEHPAPNGGGVYTGNALPPNREAAPGGRKAGGETLTDAGEPFRSPTACGGVPTQRWGLPTIPLGIPTIPCGRLTISNGIAYPCRRDAYHLAWYSYTGQW